MLPNRRKAQLERKHKLPSHSFTLLSVTAVCIRGFLEEFSKCDYHYPDYFSWTSVKIILLSLTGVRLAF